MRSLKIYLLFLLIPILISGIACNDGIKRIIDPDNPFDPDNPDKKEEKFAKKVVITYERIDPCEYTNDYYNSHVNLNIQLDGPFGFDGWNPIQNTKMEKITEKEFKYTVEKLPYETRLYMYVQDFGRSSEGGPEFNGELFEILGQKLTREKGFIRGDPMGNDNEIAAFIIKKDDIVVPWD